jgi:hypothetical protein
MLLLNGEPTISIDCLAIAKLSNAMELIAMKTNLKIRNCPTQFRFVCPMTWDSLALTEKDDVRHCDQCSRDVHFCVSDEETIAHAKAGHCIAREVPYNSELPAVYVGMPKSVSERTPQQEQAAKWSMRERGIDDSIKNADSVRACPKCDFPAPPWRISCRVCGFEMGRIPW